MGSRDRGNSVPEDLSGPWMETAAGMIHREVLDAICVEMNFALVGMRKTIE
jgi:hypothetical protein